MKMKTLQCSESISDPSQFPSLMGGGVDGSNEYSTVAQPSEWPWVMDGRCKIAASPMGK